MIIRRMALADVNAVNSAGTTSCEFDVSKNVPAFWPRQVIERWCRSRQDLALVAEDNCCIVGFAIFACHRVADKATLENIWVDAAKRRGGIARQLTDAACIILKKRGYRFIVALADVRNANIRKAILRFGFKKGACCNWFDRVL